MNTRRLVMIAVFTALIVVGGLVSVPIPYTQVQLSFQTVFVIMAGILLGGTDGALSVLVYIVMGLSGLPVFTQGGGIGYVLMPSFGYLIGFPLSALISGALCARFKRRDRSRIFAAALLGMIPTYVIGIAYQVLILYYYIGSAWSAVIGGIPAILVLAVKDGVLLGLVSILCPVLDRALRSMGHERNGGKTRKNVGDITVNTQK